MRPSYPVKALFCINRIPLPVIEKFPDLGKLVKKENSFLLFQKGDTYIYIKDYGGVVFLGYTPEEVSRISHSLKEGAGLIFSEYTDELVIRLTDDKDEQYGELNIKELTLGTAHIICLNLAQSAALFYYQSLSDQLLENTKSYTSELERKGKVSLKRKKLMKYIGSTLNIKNKISENLYVFDTPMLAYENENINAIDSYLKEELEIKYRYNAIKEQLNITKENLDLFKDMNMHQHSSNLEWIIIWLILFEVIHVIIDQLF